jgi:hypothetical protein
VSRLRVVPPAAMQARLRRALHRGNELRGITRLSRNSRKSCARFVRSGIGEEIQMRVVAWNLLGDRESAAPITQTDTGADRIGSPN